MREKYSNALANFVSGISSVAFETNCNCLIFSFGIVNPTKPNNHWTLSKRAHIPCEVELDEMHWARSNRYIRSSHSEAYWMAHPNSGHKPAPGPKTWTSKYSLNQIQKPDIRWSNIWKTISQLRIGNVVFQQLRQQFIKKTVNCYHSHFSHQKFPHKT